MSIAATLSANGASVAFVTPAALVESDRNGVSDVYVRALVELVVEEAPDRTGPQLNLSAAWEEAPGPTSLRMTDQAEDWTTAVWQRSTSGLKTSSDS